MPETIKLALLLVTYIGASYFIIKQVKQALKGTNQYVRAVIISGVYALFWGIGIAGTGGELGFALPAPNLIALGLMAYIGFYKGWVVGLCVVCFWWVVILVGMLIKLKYKQKTAAMGSRFLFIGCQYIMQFYLY